MRLLPTYTYVPGRSPHPISDPAGHMHEKLADEVRPIDWTCARRQEEFAYAVRLFNAGYFWEAHEVWEGVWISLGRVGPAADIIKGFIKLAAAGVKSYEGRRAGVMRHLQRASELLVVELATVPAELIDAVSTCGDRAIAATLIMSAQEIATRFSGMPPQLHKAAAAPIPSLLGELPLATT